LAQAAPGKDCPVILFPAIDLKDGRCVRLARGEMAAATVFNDDPAAQASIFAAQGFRYLHLVDLNGAFAGRPVNAAAVQAILKAVTIPVQLGGGIRDLATIETWLGKGVRRVILGTLALRNPGLVREACRLFPGRIAVGIDARGGKVAVEGWAETSEVSVLEMATRYQDAGVAAIIHTDIDRDGVLKGLNLPATAELARSTSIPVIASGGLAGIDDVKALLRPQYAMLEGAIAGRALYDGRLDPAEALALLLRTGPMNHTSQGTAGRFGERGQTPFEDIPTDIEGFLEWGTKLDPDHPFKYELSNGRVSRTMIQVSRKHWVVTANILAELLSKLNRSRFQAGPREFGIRTGAGVRYPDVIVDRASSRTESLACEAPIFIAEVLSPSTAGLDFTGKLREYLAIETVQTYLICSQDEPRAWVWQRQPDGAWPELPVELAGRSGRIALGKLGIELAMADMFVGIPDPPTVE
jgi:phosphoribosylformimino-5-aminoimidazole carboxamide ribotide isomerase